MASSLTREVELVGLVISPVPKGGDCLPLAIANQLGLVDGPTGSQTVRKEVASTMKQDPKFHELFTPLGVVVDAEDVPVAHRPSIAELAASKDWNGYVEHMAQPGSHWGMLELLAVCSTYHVRVHVIGGVVNYTIQCPWNDEAPTATLYLAFDETARHYDSVRLPGSIEGPANVPDFHARPHSRDTSITAKERRKELHRDGHTSALLAVLPQGIKDVLLEDLLSSM